MSIIRVNELYYELEIITREIEILELQLQLSKLLGNNDDIKEYEKAIKEKKGKEKCILNKIRKDKPDERLNNKIILGDCLDVLPNIPSNSVDLFLSDIPYGINLDEWDVLHNNTNSALLGVSPGQVGKSGFKKRGKPINGWNEDDRNNNKYYEEWCFKWALMLYDIMKEGAPVFIFGGRRTIHAALIAMERAGFLVKDVLAWKKDSAHHRSQDVFKVLARRGTFKLTKEKIEKVALIVGIDIAIKLEKIIDVEYDNSKKFINALEEIDPILKKKYLYETLEIAQNDDEVSEQIATWKGWRLGNLAPIYEPIAWLFKPYSLETLTDNLLENKVGAMNLNECKIDGKSPTNILEFSFSEDEKKNKLHEAQKPLELIKYLIKLTTLENQIVLDAFLGSGTTALACKELNRKYIGIEKNPETYEIAIKRLKG